MGKEANIPSRRGRPLSDDEREDREDAYRGLDIDHKIPGTYAKGMKDEAVDKLRLWLKPENLQFMFGDDNRFYKGDRYFR